MGTLTKNGMTNSIDVYMDDLFKNIEKHFIPSQNFTENNSMKAKYAMNDTHFMYLVPAPGCSEKDISVELDGELLTVTTETNGDYSFVSKNEIRLNKHKYDLDGVEASIENGLISVKIPFAKEEKNSKRKIL